MGSVTDPYQPVEDRIQLTRLLLQAMVERGDRPKLVVQTRSPLVVRDCDLFRGIEAAGGEVWVNVTITTDDEAIRRTFEPHCPSNVRRLDAANQVALGGVNVGITMTPLLLVRDPAVFAERLAATEAARFIVQPFHFQRGRFVAGTREDASDLMAQKLDYGRRARADVLRTVDRFIAEYVAERGEADRMEALRRRVAGRTDAGWWCDRHRRQDPVDIPPPLYLEMFPPD